MTFIRLIHVCIKCRGAGSDFVRTPGKKVIRDCTYCKGTGKGSQ